MEVNAPGKFPNALAEATGLAYRATWFGVSAPPRCSRAARPPVFGEPPPQRAPLKCRLDCWRSGLALFLAGFW